MSDPADFSKVKLLLLGNGSNGSTTFTDSSADARTVTGYGTAQISTARSKYGGASISLTTGYEGEPFVPDYLTIPDSADFDFGSGDFTVEFWYYRAEFGSGQRHLAGKRVGTGNYPFHIATDSSNKFIASAYNTSSTLFSIAAGASALENNWYHVVLVRNGSDLKLYINGAQSGSTVTISGAVFQNSAPVCIGASSASQAAGAWNTLCILGNVDDVRITKGEALYTGTSFTPPTAELRTDGFTLIEGYTSAAGPLGAPQAFASILFASASDPGPLGQAAARGYSLAALSSAAGPLGGALALTFHDFTASISTGATDYYVCDLIDGATTTRVPISSWQGTLQVSASSYLQAVIPAAADVADAVLALSAEAEFVISRGARLPSGESVEVEMARSTVEQIQLDQGPQRYTCTISGYGSAFVAPAVAYAETNRALAGVRSISSGTSGTRVRCAIDWLLQPGQIAVVDGTEFTASYINYYVQARESYMDVGERVV